MLGVKLFVFNKAPGYVWRNRTDNGALAGAQKASRGRIWWPADLSARMLNVVGLIYLGHLVSLYQLPVPLEYLFGGIMLGATAGLVVVVRRERREGELPPEQVRHIEFACVAAGVALMACAALVQIALNALHTL